MRNRLSAANELVAGTNPTNGTDFAATYISISDSTNLAVSMNAKAGRSYLLLSSTNLAEGSWVPTNSVQHIGSDQPVHWDFAVDESTPTRFFKPRIHGVMDDPVSYGPNPPTAENGTGGNGILDNGYIRLESGSGNGCSLTHLSVDGGTSLINIHDQGRLIQQSYYAGPNLDRTAVGQSPSWSPWPWNPIQGGDASGAAAEVLEVSDAEFGAGTYTRTIPLLWDMTTAEQGQCVMHQWNQFEPGMTNVIRVTCKLTVHRDLDDEWEGARNKHQELPATYFLRSLSKVVAYTNAAPWTSDATSELAYSPGPPWFRAYPTEDWIAQVNPATDTGMGVYSPIADSGWWYGAAGASPTGGPTSGRTMHMAPLGTVKLDRRSVLVYRYWMIYGDLTEIRSKVYELHSRHPHG
jgi:hypothetical protein